MAVGDALRRLCEEVGWSYAVFWKAIGAADPVHLVWEDGYCGHASCPAGSEASEVGCESGGTVCTLVRKVMASQVHVVGEGIIGRAAFTGNHQWIVHDTANDHVFGSEVAAEMNHQFRAGIQTIAIIPVLPRGVLQLGSTSVVMENTNFVLQYKRLCSQLNNRSSMVASASVKNDVSQKFQPRSLHGLPSIYSADACSKAFSGSPVTYEQCYGPGATIVSSSTSANTARNASLLKVAQRNGQAVRDHSLYAPDMRFRQQTPYCDKRVESNTQSSVVSSGFTSSISTSVEKNPLLMTNIGQLELGNTAESSEARNLLLKYLASRNPVVHENTNTLPLHGGGEVSDFLNGGGNFDFLPAGTRVVKANLYNSTASQVLDRRCNSTSGMIGHKPANSYKIPQSAQFIMKMESPKRESFQAPAAPSSGSDVQVLSGLKSAISQENQLSSSDHVCRNQKANEVNDSSVAISMQGVKNMDGHKLPDIFNERTSSFLMDPTTENDLFDMFGIEFHHLCRNVDGDLTWNAAKPESSDRDAPESSVYLDTSPVFGTLDEEFPYSGIFSLTDTDQLLDAVISNVNPGGKQISGDSASCKTSLTDIPSSSYCGSKETKQCESSGAPPLLVKNELAVSNFVKQPYVQEKAEDGCLSQNNGMHKSQIRLWIESGQNMKCESVSASNSKGHDTPNKANRKRSRPGENPKPRPKDRQLIHDRIKELRELVPNGAKCSIDALLEKTIKHMLFLQSVTKHADNFKDSNESKILGGENGPLWKDYVEGGATWAFDVGNQSMTCPIIVEDLDRPRQMLVEMICEDRGIFLEIADFIKGLGLTILRGVMEARKNKIWARFTVDANRDVTRMEILFWLVRLVEPRPGSSHRSTSIRTALPPPLQVAATASNSGCMPMALLSATSPAKTTHFSLFCHEEPQHQHALLSAPQYRGAGGKRQRARARWAAVSAAMRPPDAAVAAQAGDKEGMATTRKPRVLVAGGGIGGLVFALAARRKGYEVTVFERDISAVRGEGQYRGPIQIQSNALAALEAIDMAVAEEVMREGCVTGDRINGLVDGISGSWYIKFDTFTPAAERGLPVTRVISRMTLQQILGRAVGDDAILNDSHVIDFIDDGNKVTAILEDGRKFEGDLLVGADGIWSKVRKALFGHTEATYSGYSCYTGIADFVPPDIDTVGYRVFLGHKQYFVSSDVGAGKMQWYAFHNEPAGGTDPENGKKKRLLEIFSGWCDNVIDLINATEEEAILRRDIYDRPPTLNWGKGRVTLLGDSVHAMQPNLGQGGCMAIEDGYQLAVELEKAWQESVQFETPMDIVSSLRSYEKERRLRVAVIHGLARMAAIMATTYRPYLGVGLGPLSFLTKLRIPHPGRVGGRFFIKYGMPLMLSWVLGGNSSKLEGRSLSCRLSDKANDQLHRWFEDDDALEQALGGEWYLFPTSAGNNYASQPIRLIKDEQMSLSIGSRSDSSNFASSLTLPFPQISENHATITCKNKAFYLTDLGSEHGTWITDNEGRRYRVPPNFPVRFHPSDVIEFGSDKKAMFRVKVLNTLPYESARGGQQILQAA